jgi:formate hydrogenlyase subunit 3/multisubunit Na+/H+ antiporter MnhD subunit
MKKTISILSLLLLCISVYACPVCERANAKKAFGSISHGTGANSNWDYVAVWVTIIISIVALFYSIKWLIKPAEKNSNHIKYSILNFV